MYQNRTPCLQVCVLLLAGFVLASMVFLSPAWAASSAMDQFSKRLSALSDLVAGSPLSALGPTAVQLGSLSDGSAVYVKNDENLAFGLFQAQLVVYCFEEGHKDRRLNLAMAFLPGTARDAVVGALTQLYGKPDPGDDGSSVWLGPGQSILVLDRGDDAGCVLGMGNMGNSDKSTSSEVSSGGLQLLDAKWEEQNGVWYIVGHVKNNTSSSYESVSIAFNVYDSEGNQVDYEIDIIQNLESGGVWKFRILMANDEAQTFKVVGLGGTPESSDASATTTTDSSAGFTF